MKLLELEQYLLSALGQYLVAASVTDLGMSLDTLLQLTDRAMKEYAQYKPLTRSETLTAVSAYTFAPRVPLFVSSVLPVIVPHVFGATVSTHMPRRFVYEYRKPTLYLSVGNPGELAVEACYDFSYRATDATGTYRTEYGAIYQSSGAPAASIGPIVDADIPELSFADNLFMDLIESRFLMAVARSRRAFVLQDLAITSDADVLFSDAKQQYDDTMLQLRETDSDWYLGVHP